MKKEEKEEIVIVIQKIIKARKIKERKEWLLRRYEREVRLIRFKMKKIKP